MICSKCGEPCSTIMYCVGITKIPLGKEISICCGAELKTKIKDPTIRNMIKAKEVIEKMKNKIMKEIKCPSCGSSDDYDIKGRVKFECTQCLRIYDIPVDDNDWKNLDIKAPLEVLINMNKYQIQIYSANEGWRDTEIKDEVQLFEKINNQFTKYRYRLKPLEPKKTMQVTQDVFDMIFQETIKRKNYSLLRADTNVYGDLFLQGQKVEII